jgi:hypothetical protein
VKVTKVLVPLPCLVVSMSSKAEGLCYLHFEDIESIGASGYLGSKAEGLCYLHVEGIESIGASWWGHRVMIPSLISPREPLLSSCLGLMMEFLNAGM